MDILGKFLRENLVPKADWIVEIEESAMHFAQHRVPDIQIKHKFRKIYWMIDVKCQYDSPSNMSNRDEWNQAKYSDVVTATRNSLGQAWDVRILSFVIGCLGSWYIPNGEYLSQLAFSSEQIEQLAFDCAKSAVKSSAAVWKKFIGAIEAVQDNEDGPNYDDDPSDT